MEQILSVINPKFLIPMLAWVVAIDVLMGVIKSLKSGTFEAKKMFEGVEKQLYIVIPVGFCYLFDMLIPASKGMFTNMACIFYIGYEGGSIIENLGESGFKMPKFLKAMFAMLNEVDTETILPKPEEKPKE